MIDLGEFSDSIRILEGDPIVIQVARIEWHGPHDPCTFWDTFKELPKESTDDDIQKVIDKLMKSRKYFKKCKACSEIKLAGHLNGDICHSCMEEDGIIF